ncbi:histidine kinase [Chitinophaga polysaccharea]|uniref:sensor histidine kinase n=1 Tax=Chitinophaga TaxID=79328 RepID=UPI001454EE2F|nr:MULTISPECIES: histidine kinase [Chitinophaga]NLR61469.1 histidine kinase [Chitinophaga polysaccharea]NLU95306.1 histidine kinase [Chitinophaga sp. Ak27]
MNKRVLITLHIAFWLLVAVIAALAPALARNNGQFLSYWMVAFLFYLTNFYANLCIIFPRWMKTRQLWPMLLSWLGLMIIDTPIIIFINSLFGVYQAGDYWYKTVKFFFHSGWILSMLLPVSIGYQFALDWFRNDRLRRQLENQQLKTELAFLKSQINPHFFFNTLNSIYILAYQQSDKTADAVMRLSDMMQYMLYESNGEQVPLHKEVAYIEQLIALQQLRMLYPDNLQLHVEGALPDITIAPLLLIPFVENVFKHAALNEPNEKVSLQLQVSDRHLTFHCRNKINQDHKDSTGGIGLSNVKRRLGLLYPGKHTLDISTTPTHYMVTLVLTTH